MGVLLHWTFQASFADRSAAAEEITQRGLRPLLDALEYWPELRAGVSLNGALLERADPRTLDALARFAADGRIGILLEPYAPPAARWREADSLEAQLDITARIWADVEVKTFAGVFLPRPISRSSAAGLGAYPLVLSSSTAVELDSPISSGARLPLKGNDGSVILIRVGAEEIFAEQQTPLQRRNALIDALKDARTEPGLLVSPERYLAERAGDAIGEFISAASGESILPELAPLAVRLDRLAEELAPLPEKIKTMPKEAQNITHLQSATKALLAARSSELWASGRTGVLRRSRAVVEYMLRARVEADAILYPDVDPAVGWVGYSVGDLDGDGADDVVADSQLIRLVFSAGTAGALTAAEYKAKKSDLVAAFHPGGNCESFVDACIEVSPEALTPADLPGLNAKLTPAPKDWAETLVTKHTKDLFGVRIIRSVADGRWVKHFTLKAGIGAHLANSTTGFFCEYWLEGQEVPQAGTYAVSRFTFMLPSGTDSGASLRPLASAGGESEKVFPLEKPLVLKHGDISGGLYGGRLIDGIGNFVMDVRSAKPLSALGCYPLRFQEGEAECFGGLVLLFFVEAKRVFEDDKANTIFLSIR